NRGKRGRPYKFSYELILSIYLLYVFLDKSLSKVLDFIGDLIPILPHRTTIIKRLDKLDLYFKDMLEENKRKVKSKRKLTLIYDSTGLSHRIGGYYRISKYGSKVRRWFKLHVIIDMESQTLLSYSITTDDISDVKMLEQMLIDLRGWYKGEVELYSDKIADSHKIYELCRELGIRLIVPPISGAKFRFKNRNVRGEINYLRDRYIYEKNRYGYDYWRDKYKYGKRWLVETYFSRLKMILGEKVRGRNFENVVRYVLGMLILLSNFIFLLCIIPHITKDKITNKTQINILNQIKIQFLRRIWRFIHNRT
ncbi:IS5 family transposase, partial [Candidatus Micrarchaeota archaeon]|nr:IS5 family transposase [Candidatus Micrarchaeota archaeon]